MAIYIKKNKKPIEKIPKPSESDYKNGFIYRYFIKEKNSNIVIEIDERQYNKFKNDLLYETIKIKWYISGNKELISELNLNEINLAQLKIKELYYLKNNIFRFFK